MDHVSNSPSSDEFAPVDEGVLSSTPESMDGPAAPVEDGEDAEAIRPEDIHDMLGMSRNLTLTRSATSAHRDIKQEDLPWHERAA